jgi:biotin synthase
LDAATPFLFESVKGNQCEGPYTWDEHISLLDKAVEIFGRGCVSTHLIIGLGENEQEALQLIQQMTDKGILTALFALYPIPKTRFEFYSRPSIVNFRKIQLGKYGIDTHKWRIPDLCFTSQGVLTHFPLTSQELRSIISLSSPFETSGCPGCNRPYYTSSPREEQYNYPQTLTSSEQNTIYEELLPFCRRDIH